MQYFKSRAVSVSHVGLAPPGGPSRSAASSRTNRHDVVGCTATAQNLSSGCTIFQLWALTRSQERLQSTTAIRDSQKAGRTSNSRSNVDAVPQKRSSRPRPRRPKHAQQQQQQQTSGSAPSPSPLPEAPSRSGGPVHVGQELELECARLALEGKGVCLLPPTGFVVLVERTLPGEHVRAEVVSVRRGYAEARKLASLSPHRNAVPPPCPYFGPCGGCTLQSLQYEAQLQEKRNQVEQTLRRVGRLGPSLDQLAAEAAACRRDDDGGGESNGGDGGSRAGGGVAAAAGCQDPFAYRNKMMFHFSTKCWLPPDMVEERPCLGLLRPGTADVVLPVVQHGCKLQGAEANVLLARAEQLVLEQGLLPYNHPSGKGTLKHLIIRSGSGARPAGSVAPVAAGELLIGFGVTHGSAMKQLKPVAEALGGEFPNLVGVVAQVVALPQPFARGTAAVPPGGLQRGSRDRGPRHGDGARKDAPGSQPPPPPADNGDALDGEDLAGGTGTGAGPVTLLYGTPYIHDNVGGLTFRISPGSFFQTNSRQAEVLYDIVRRAAALRPGAVDTVLDLYCGTGTIGLSLAADCRRVVGVEVADTAVEDARSNASLNSIDNATFVCADVDTIQRNLLAATLEEPAPTAATATSGVVPAPDVVIVDPARGGLSLDAAAFLSRCGARRVVYVSCNVATQARDLDRLCNGPGAPFRLVSVQPVDMFPHTDHVEVVTVLERRELQLAATATATATATTAPAAAAATSSGALGSVV
ncbi:hypothetical protein Vretimale_17074 [Volvox reticuliferus]|uniref:TRAM domain-containing protein n=1 Tax=Volvox reticuliferus TaxID=1737510 RepID=A0A8J4GUZ2_9CHLO|nr:hypothetical protein Vretifemale_18680 [Volvox reticuliferus]GIM14048.1 hypothetical protein Vretimale_17074 [Volvox reticuliferus]